MNTSVLYYWYDHLLLRENGDAENVTDAINRHDFDAFKRIRDKYQPNKNGWVYFPDTASVWNEDTGELIGQIDINEPENFARITFNEYECG